MINQQLIDFIKAQTQRGLDTAAISTLLINNGWKTEDIEAAFASLSTVQQNPVPVRPTSVEPAHSTMSVYIIVGLAILVGCIFGAYKFAVVPPAPPAASPEVDCGSASYASPKDEGDAMASSTCFNTQFKMCTPAKQVGYFNDTVSTHEIVGMKGTRCNVTYTTVVSNSNQPAVIWSCLFDPSKPVPTSFDEQEKDCTVSQ